MIKYYYILSIALKNLFKHKFRALAIALPLTLIILIVSAMSFYRQGVKRDALLAVKYFPDILLQQQVGGRTESLHFDRYEDVLKEIEGIKSFFPRVWGYINFTDSQNNSKAFIVMGLGTEYINSGFLLDVAIEKGRTLAKNDKRKGMIGKALASSFNCKTGDVIEVTSPDMKKNIPVEVIGIFNSSVQIYTADLLFVDIDTAREILGFYEEYESSDILVYPDNPSMTNVICKEIVSKIEGAKPLTKSVMLNLTEQSFGQKSGIFHLLWLILLVNVIIIAWSSMNQISFNLKKEIGILKAIGWDTGDIMVLKTVETSLIGLFSVTTGILGGILYMFFNAPGLKQFIIGWSDIYPDFPIPLYIDSSTVMLITILGIFPLLAGTLVPIWRIGIIDPDEAIRK